MRLIDADKLIEDLSDITGERLHGNRKVRYGEIYGAISLQPTAYDVDKVVEEIQEATYCDLDEEDYDNGCCVIDMDAVLDIVKRGGVDEN